MSTFLIEPGAKLANRYRLDQVVSETGGATRWKATDETLARPVAVWTFAEGFPRTSEVVHAARATSRIPDARVTQVFDADDNSAVPYVVEEWVVGSSLADLLAQGPMEPERAAGLVAEAAEAIAAAHAGGLHHLCLTPGKLMWSNGGAVKVTGIGVDSALLGANVADPAAIDAQGLGNLLYAALTGHWPGGPQSGLPAAPQGLAGPFPPGQVRAGITEPLATITTRAALPHLVGQMVPGPPITSPAEFCAAMAEVPRLIPLPVAPAESTPPPEPGTSRRTGEFDAAGTGPRRSSRNGGNGRNGSVSRGAERATASRMEERAARTQRSPKRVLVGVAAVVVFAAVVMGAWVIGSKLRPGDEDQASPSSDTSDEVSDSPELTTLEITGADGFDPHGDDNDEHTANAPKAYDDNPSTAWNTQEYFSELSINKAGVGLRLDLGESHDVHQVDLNLSEAAHQLEIRVGDTEADSEDGYEVAWEGSVNGEETITLDPEATGQYVLIWFTGLPQDGGQFRGSIYEVEVRGI